jgi:Peptidase family M48
MKRLHLPICALILSSALWAQFDPQGAEALSYFPHLADGGSAVQHWTTALTFVNPHESFVANGRAYFYGNDGSPLALDFGKGRATTLDFSLPPQGSATFVSASTSQDIVVGWAVVASTLPIQGVVQFRFSINGVPQQGVASQQTQASWMFRSVATPTTGIAIANVNPTASVPITISALDSNGKNVGTFTRTMPPLAHDAFTFGQLFSGLTGTFRGTVVIQTINPATYVVAWTVSGDGGVLSSLPAANLGWPISQAERIRKVFQKVLNAAAQSYPQIVANPPTLVIDTTTGSINSYADLKANTVHIFLNLAELISDSESELGFVVAHEIGHIIQLRLNKLVFLPNIEFDADVYGLILALEAGYDPYGSAGALSKLSMASGDAGLVSQEFDNINGDPHGSFNNRIAAMFIELQLACSQAQVQTFCAQYKAAIHPHLPPNTPLVQKAPETP